MRHLESYRVAILATTVVAGGLLASCSEGPPPAPAQSSAAVSRANPASENCIQRGGQLHIEKTPRGDEFGVCSFEDNHQCEEWALLRGECQAGGIRVTGYVTDAARFCAITGGTYTVVDGSNAAAERGTCQLPGGKECDADAYFNGDCSRSP